VDEFPFWMKVLRYLNRYDDVIKTSIAKELDVTYSHIVKLLADLHKEGLVSFRVDGRSMFVTLTPKGKSLAQDIDKVMTSRNIPVVVQRGV
jgi:DNA-binding MarR family transcriptional regulator